jgi:hypothetical protein
LEFPKFIDTIFARLLAGEAVVNREVLPVDISLDADALVGSDPEFEIGFFGVGSDFSEAEAHWSVLCIRLI